MEKYDKDASRVLADEDIVALYFDRNESAIDETDKKYGKYLYTIASNIIHDNMDCEECLNDTYLSTWNRIPPTRPKILKIFLSKIMRDVAVDRYRKDSAKKRVPSELTVSLEEISECFSFTSSAEEEFLVRQVSIVLNGYLRTLDKRKLCIFICRYYYADSIKDIAKMFRVSETTVFRDLAAVREGIKEKLSEMGYSYEQK